jgi:hypothetical protein
MISFSEENIIMNIRFLCAFYIAFILISTNSFAESFKIPLNDFDQSQLTDHMAHLNPNYKSEETINENSHSWYVLRKYNYLDASQAFYIHCSEKFYAGSTVGDNQRCEVGFNYALSSSDSINVHNGFMENFAIAEIKDQTLACDLYNSLSNGSTPKSTSYFSREEFQFTHPTTGARFSAFRLRIDCKRNDSFKNFSCIVYAVK